MKKQFLIITFIFFYCVSFSQNIKIIDYYNDSLFKLSTKIIQQDSSYWLNAEIKLLKKVCVQIPQEIIFDYGQEKKNPFSNAGIFLAKNIRFHFVYFVMDDWVTIKYDRTGDFRKFICLKTDSTVKVEVDLQSLFPIEKGTYKIYYFVDVFIEGKKTRIFSEPIYFEATHDPPNSSRF
ncbi:MAG: hypothetical protein IPL97_10495 [Niastella sp.]|nr:hypothetical protein [Niastella sp.]